MGFKLGLTNKMNSAPVTIIIIMVQLLDVMFV